MNTHEPMPEDCDDEGGIQYAQTVGAQEELNYRLHEALRHARELGLGRDDLQLLAFASGINLKELR